MDETDLTKKWMWFKQSKDYITLDLYAHFYAYIYGFFSLVVHKQ